MPSSARMWLGFFGQFADVGIRAPEHNGLLYSLDTAGRAEKSEIRNSKSETNPKFETKKTPMNLPGSQK